MLLWLLWLEGGSWAAVGAPPVASSPVPLCSFGGLPLRPCSWRRQEQVAALTAGWAAVQADAQLRASFLDTPLSSLKFTPKRKQ